ncbi:hypothetical protein HUA78_23360 [Myxococcus sp. CA033]|uniref:hypothetical protein n=1 Tax=Myxococcus sp. CA033 TaxID=2741516 RepID=UPI00157B3C45|nr:hypothetical protein [Myxococcus sp. CA033]NTX37396.1 hypothetical protein [Myxococcus sp. CA033]
MSSPSVDTLPVSAPPPTASPTVEPERFTLHAWTTARRGVAMSARFVTVGSLLFFTAWLLWDILEGAETLKAEPLVWSLVLGGGLPLALVAVLRSRARATLEVGDSTLTLTLRDGARLEIPLDAVESVRPWRLPLPGPGLTLRLKSGRALGYGLEAEDAVPLLEALARREGSLGAAVTHPLVRYGRARRELWRKRWYHLVLKLVVFPLVPAGIFFRAHQYIAFGGPFGEYQLNGLKAYLLSFGRYYAPVTLSLLLIACFWRGVAELVSLAAARFAPSWTRGVRRGVEWLCRLMYYAGIMAFTASRFLM